MAVVLVWPTNDVNVMELQTLSILSSDVQIHLIRLGDSNFVVSRKLKLEVHDDLDIY